MRKAQRWILPFVASILAVASTVLAPGVASAAPNATAVVAGSNPIATGASGRTPLTGALPGATTPKSAQTVRSADTTSTTSPRAVPPPNETKAANCPPGVTCKIVIAALADGGCNWSPATRPNDLSVYGINIHTTEGSVDSALAEAQDTSVCISWNYLIGPDGTVYVSVPVDSLAYDVSNWWENTHYVEIEQAAFSNDCPTVTAADYRSLVILSRWLVGKFHIDVSPATVTGHVSVPGVNDHGQAAQHWDPGVCWDWGKYLADLGAPIVATAGPDSPVVTVNNDNSMQPVENCPGTGFTSCTTGPAKTNFLAVYTAPSTSSPLVSDPYLHPDGSAGSNAEQDWGDKAETGHDYVVISRSTPGWLEIWYGGATGWIQDNSNSTVNTAAYVVTPKSSSPVAVYGRPMPEYNAPGWANIPYDHQSQVALTQYAIPSGQMYPIAAVPRLGATAWPGEVSNDYSEGCNLADCTGPGDGTVVHGSTVYLQIDYNGRYAFVQLADVNVEKFINGKWYDLTQAPNGTFSFVPAA